MNNQEVNEIFSNSSYGDFELQMENELTDDYNVDGEIFIFNRENPFIEDEFSEIFHKS